MAETLQRPLRASSSFSCFPTLFFVHSQTLFTKPSRYCNFINAIPSFGPLRLPNRRDRYRNILSKLNAHSDSNSDSDSSDFGLISAAELSNGSFIFRFGNAKDKEAMVAEKVSERSNDSEKAKARSKNQQRSNKTQLSGEAKTFIDDGISSSANEGLSCSNSSVDGEILSNVIDSDFDEDIEGIYEDESSELNSGSVISHSSASLASNNVNETNDTCATSISKSEVLSLDEETNNVTTITSTEILAEKSLDEDKNPSASSDEIVIAKPIEALVETSLDEEDLTRTSDETETSIQLGHSESSTNEVKVEQIKDGIDIVEELPVPEALEVEEIKDEVYVVEKLPVSEALEVEEIKDEICVVEELPISEALEVEETPNCVEISTEEFVLSSGASLLRHPTEGVTGGEDAYFVTCENWLGVADGVGQWSLEGISDGRYAQELMENCKRIVSDCEATPLSDPSEVLVRSVAETESSGSSTILVAHFDGRAFKVSNIGDSGFIIIREGSVFQQSSHIVHEFNFPLHVERGDDPSELIEAYKIDLDEGDVIITATDGLFDNLYDQEIASFVLESLEAGLGPQDIAESLCSKAQEVARSSSKKTPFSDAAQKAGYSGYSGGKLDNVVVIVSVVQKK